MNQNTVTREFKAPKIKRTSSDVNIRQISIPSNLEDNIIDEAGIEAYLMITEYIDLECNYTHVLSSSTLFNILNIPRSFAKAIVNLKRINDFRRINKYFELINDRLDMHGVFIGCCEPLEYRKQRLLKKYPGILNYFYLLFDFIFKRVIPKLPLTKQIYFALTGGRNRVISRAEAFGRLYSCGFQVLHEQRIGYLLYFVAKKVKLPAFDPNPSYGLLFGMNRTGKNGKPLKVYKFRTMYPFSEYLQQYIYEKNSLEKGGKFKNDFRVTTCGKLMRKFWIDELPMIYNLLRLDLKLVGVRPLSKQYQSLYPTELIQLRHTYKPGLIPPYYADLPQGLDEIIQSEQRYLEAYQKNPFTTDWKYFWKAFVNIIIKKARSK